MLFIQSTLFELARTKLSKHDEVHLQKGKHGKTMSYQIGDFVLAEHRSTFRRGPKSKLMAFLRGPLRIINIIGEQNDTFVLQDIVNNKQKTYHVSKIHPYDYDPVTQDQLHAAIRDDQYHIIEKIVSFREIKTSNARVLKKNFEFKVRWKGYTANDDTWEPFTTLSKTRQLYDYLKDHSNPRIRKLTPKNIVIDEGIIDEIISSEDEIDIHIK